MRVWDQQAKKASGRCVGGVLDGPTSGYGRESNRPNAGTRRKLIKLNLFRGLCRGPFPGSIFAEKLIVEMPGMPPL